MYWQMVAMNLQFACYSVLTNGYFQPAVLQSYILAKGCYTSAIYWLHYLANGCYQSACICSNGVEHFTIKLQFIRDLIFANRCHKLAGTCSNIFVNGCYKPAGFRSNIYLRMVTINLQLWLPVLTHEVYQFAARRRDVSAMIDINLPFIRYFSRGWYQLTGVRRHVFANGHWKFAVH